MLVATCFSTAFVSPMKPHTEGRNVPVVMLGRRQLTTGGALFALGAFAGEAKAGLGEPRKADQAAIGVSSVAIPAQSSSNALPANKGPLGSPDWDSSPPPAALPDLLLTPPHTPCRDRYFRLDGVGQVRVAAVLLGKVSGRQLAVTARE